MTQPTTQMQRQGQGSQVATTQKARVDLLKSIMDADSVKAQFTNALGKHSGTFVASVIDLYNSDSKLQLCEPKAIVMEALKAAVLHLHINKALGYAYVLPFLNTKKVEWVDEAGNKRSEWRKVYEPSFQIGYKGLIQLAMRTGQYRTLNADVVYEGELRKGSKLTGAYDFEGTKISDKVIGYFCYFELLNGFNKTLYVSVEQMAAHAKRYSKALTGKEITVESLLNLANLPVAPDSKTVGWLGNFHGMAIKTVIRNLLSKYGYLSVEMQNAIASDYESEDAQEGAGKALPAQDHGSAPISIDASTVEYEEVADVNVEHTAPQEEQAPY